jgi:hypothetical protein
MAARAAAQATNKVAMGEKCIALYSPPTHPPGEMGDPGEIDCLGGLHGVSLPFLQFVAASHGSFGALLAGPPSCTHYLKLAISF